MLGDANHNNTLAMSKYAPDLAKHPYYVWLNNYHWVPTVVLAAVLYAMGGLPFVMWGIFVRVVLCFPRHLVRQFRYAHVGIAPVQYQRRFHQQLVGGPHHFRRGMAQ